MVHNARGNTLGNVRVVAVTIEVMAVKLTAAGERAKMVSRIKGQPDVRSVSRGSDGVCEVG